MFRSEQEIMQNWNGDLSQPIVSICSTAYNLEFCIKESIDSFLMQETKFPFEIILRDDCSTDNTAKIIQDYASQYPRIIKPIYEKENTYSRGIKPMLQAIKVASGKYIATCDADDFWTDPLKLQKQVDFLESNPEFAGCFHDCKRIYEDNGEIVKENFRIGDRKIQEEVDLESIIFENNIDSSSIMFSNFIRKIPKYWTDTSKDDYAMMVFIAGEGKIGYIPEVMSVYRIHNNSIWSSQNEMYKEKENLKFYNLLQEYFADNTQVLKVIKQKKRYIYYSLSRKLAYKKQRLKSLRYILKSVDFLHSSHPKLKYYTYFKEFIKSIIR